MRSTLLLVTAFLLFAPLAARAGNLPACKKTWQKEEYRYDFQESYEDFQARLGREDCEKEWTVLIYMAADHDLFPFALWDLYEMEAAFEGSKSAGSTLKTDLLVQVDGPAEDDLRRLHIFSGPVAYAAKKKDDFTNASLNDVRSPVAEILPENSSESEQARLESFLLWGAQKYPSKNYLVVVWGHGQGWKAYPVKNPVNGNIVEKTDLTTKFPATKPDKSFGGIAFRQSSGQWLDIPALRGALATFRAEIGKPVDVYASDACLMQMLEVSYELSAEARFVAGSTQIQSFLGLPYRRLLYELNNGSFNGLRKANKSSADAKDEALLLAKMIPQLMKKSLDPRRGLQGKHEKEAQKFMTSSALTSAEAENLLIPALATLSSALKDYLLEDKLRALDVQFVMQNVPNFEGGAQDLGIFLSFLDLLLLQERNKKGDLTESALALQEAVTKAAQALDRSVLSYAYGSKYGIDEKSQTVGFVPRALSLWLPVDRKEYASRRSEFLSSRFYEDSQWQAWLDVIYPN